MLERGSAAPSAIDLSVRVGDLRLANPIMPGSGTFADGLDQVIDLACLGALVTKTVTPGFRSGNPLPRVAETASGMLNSIGIPSGGMADFIARKLPAYLAFGPPIVVSVSAETTAAFADMATAVTVPGVAAIEANISCPNLEADGRAFAMDARATFRTIRAMTLATNLPIWAKLTPNVGDIAEIGQAAEAGGASALVVANTILALAIDAETRRPRLGSVTGGLSGPAIKPIIMRMVWKCAQVVQIPVIASGGIANANDVIEFMLAGASAAQVGTATFRHPTAMTRVIEGLRDYCSRHEVNRLARLIGALELPPPEARHNLAVG